MTPNRYHEKQLSTVRVTVRDDDAMFAGRDRDIVEPIVRQIIGPYDPLGGQTLDDDYHHMPNADEILSRKLLRVDDEGILHTRAGFIGAIEQELHTLGHQLVSQDRSFGIRVQQTGDAAFLGDQHPSHIRRLIDFFAANLRGRVFYRWKEHRDEIIRLIVNMFPGISILIICNDWRTAQRIARAIPSTAMRPVHVRVKPHLLWQTRIRVHVAPIGRFAGLNEDDWQIIIWADPEAAYSRRGSWLATSVRNPLQYVLVPVEHQLDREDRFWLLANFGDAAAYALPVEERPSAARVLFIPPPVKQAKITDADPLARRRQGIWHHPQRNELIAQVARACSVGNAAALQQLGVLSAHDHSIFNGYRPLPFPRVAVLVEVPEHGRALLALLAGWKLLTYPLSPQERSVDRAIVSMVWANCHGIDTDILVRADATASPWSSQWGPSCAITVDKQLLIIDTLDQFDRQARKDTERRIADYADHGWEMPASSARLLLKADDSAKQLNNT